MDTDKGKERVRRERVFSGVQPSASQVHIGNYLGAMKHFVTLAKESETIVCIVDLHALTSVSSAQSLITNTASLAAAYLAIGIDPQRTIIFRQSDVPEVCELTWYLACHFPLGLLERSHAIKDARAKSEAVNSARLFYPVLMAADILLYKATRIPVGADQKQHLEMTREVASKFNAAFGDIFPIPEPHIDNFTGVIPGLDGRKMSKSYDNYIGLFEEPKALRAAIMKIVTDSKTMEEPKDPDSCNVFGLYKLFATKEETDSLASRYREGGLGYGHAKQALFDVVDREISPIRDRHRELIKNTDGLKQILKDGSERARSIAQPTIQEVRRAVGLR